MCMFAYLISYMACEKGKFLYRVHQIPSVFGKCFKKKTTRYFLKFLFLFESTILDEVAVV